MVRLPYLRWAVGDEDRVAYLWSNATNCIHCAALFGDLQPGQSVTRRGKIYVAETPEQLLDRYRRDFPQRGRPAADHVNC